MIQHMREGEIMRDRCIREGFSGKLDRAKIKIKHTPKKIRKHHTKLVTQISVSNMCYYQLT